MWPENEPALRIFARIGTRWQYASGGMGAMVIGVRWEAIYPLMDRLGLPQALTRQRANGLNNMVGRIREAALAA